MKRQLSRQSGWILKAVLIVLALLVVAVAAFTWYVRQSPLAVYAKATRGALTKAGLELKSLDTSAGRMAYWEGGAGPPVVLLHGAGDQSGAFQGVVAGLLDDYRVLIPDIPGHGESEPTEGPLKMTVMYTGVAEFLATKAADQPVTLVGSSMGGWVSLLHGLHAPDAVARVVGINAGGLRSDRTDLSLMPADRDAARKLMKALRDPSSEPLPDFVLDDIVKRSATGPIGRMTAEWTDLEAHLLEGKLAQISVPVDLIWGESDQLLSLAYAERMTQGLPRARLTTIEKCGHHPANECPTKLAETLDRVLGMEAPAADVSPAAEDSGDEATAEEDV